MTGDVVAVGSVVVFVVLDVFVVFVEFVEFVVEFVLLVVGLFDGEAGPS